MPKPFDIATKQIVDADPLAWVRFLGLPGESAELLEADLSTSVEADRLIRVHGPDYVQHTELIASYKTDTVPDLLHYNEGAYHKYKLDVETVAVLLRPKANGPMMTGLLRTRSIDFRFHVIRVWQVSPDVILSGPLSLLPLAVVSRVSDDRIPSILGDMRDRIQAENADVLGTLFMSAITLLGLTHKANETADLIKGVWKMQNWELESSVIQEILAREEARAEARGRAEGKAEGKEEMLELLLQQRFSTLPSDITARLDGLTTEQMNDLAVALLGFTSLDDLNRWLADRA